MIDDQNIPVIQWKQIRTLKNSWKLTCHNQNISLRLQKPHWHYDKPHDTQLQIRSEYWWERDCEQLRVGTIPQSNTAQDESDM